MLMLWLYLFLWIDLTENVFFTVLYSLNWEQTLTKTIFLTNNVLLFFYVEGRLSATPKVAVSKIKIEQLLPYLLSCTG